MILDEGLKIEFTAFSICTTAAADEQKFLVSGTLCLSSVSDNCRPSLECCFGLNSNYSNGKTYDHTYSGDGIGPE